MFMQGMIPIHARVCSGHRFATASFEDYTNPIPPQILIVDKRPDTHAIFRATLVAAGFRSVIVLAKDALRHVQPEQPAACVVCLDTADSGEWMIQRLRPIQHAADSRWSC